MAAAGKDGSIPARSPAPRLSMSTKDRQHSTGSISIRFNASSIDDNWDDVSFKGPSEKNTKTPQEPLDLGLDARELIVSQSILQGVDICSKSAPESGATTPESRPGEPHDTTGSTDDTDTALSLTNQLRLAQNLTPLPPPPSANVRSHVKAKTGTERSFMSGIKERIQGMHDPLQAFTGKIEDFIVDKGIMDPRKLRKGEIVDSKAMVTSASSSGILEMEQSEPYTNGESAHSMLSQRNSDPLSLSSDVDEVIQTKSNQLDISQTKHEMSKNGHKTEYLSKHRPASFDLAASDYYAVEAEDCVDISVFENGSQTGPFPKSCSMDTFSRQSGQPPPSKESPKKKLIQKLIQPIAGRGTSGGSGASCKAVSSPGHPVTTMSLSGLLNSNTHDGDDGSTSAEEDQFFDPQDELATISKEHSPAPEPVSLTSPAEGATSHVKESTPDPALQQRDKKTYCPSRQKLMTIFAVVLAYMLVPLPTYVAGMVFGAFLATVAIFVYLWWTQPPKTLDPFILPDLTSLSPLEIPEMKLSRNDDDEFKGWMNELYQYSRDDYHIGQTHSVLIHLEGTKLRLQTPKYNIPKRAFWDEPKYYTSLFIKQRHYDLFGASVSLLPDNLVKKRLWSKKYPICLILRREQRSVSPVGPDSTIDAKPGVTQIYLFARCARDKEEWYRRFEAAAAGKPLPTHLFSVLPTSEGTHRRMSSSSSLDNFVMRHRRAGSTDSNISDSGRDIPLAYSNTSHEQRLAKYLRYMARVIPAESQKHLQAQVKAGQHIQDTSRDSAAAFRLPTTIKCEPQVCWVNALITRTFLDFLREEYWVKKIREKIQKKIGKIHIPWFIDDLTVTGCELGAEMPVIRRASKPYIDDRGLWIDLDIAYTGGFRLKLETKCNLMKLKQKPTEMKLVPTSVKTRCPTTDSDEEDSAESSTDEEAEENMDDEKSIQAPSGGTSGKILRIVDKIAQSKYFLKATEYKYIKKAMEGVSNTRLLLDVEVKNIAGTLAINIPPPPTDRLWYGFRQNPRLWLSAKPWVGEREVSLSHVTDWIERKLAVEFQRVFVMPNMDDIPIPVMCDHLTQQDSVS